MDPVDLESRRNRCLLRVARFLFPWHLDLERPLTHRFIECRLNDMKCAVASVAVI